MVCTDKNCQSTQCEHMQPGKLAMTQSSYMWSVKPAMLQSSHMYSVSKPAMPQASHVLPVKVMEKSTQKKSQVKPVMAQSTPMQSMSKTLRKQIDTQPEIIRNSDKHAVLPTHDLNVGQPMLCFQIQQANALGPRCEWKFCVLNQEVTR